jgi:hypothetical protein
VKTTSEVSVEILTEAVDSRHFPRQLSSVTKLIRFTHRQHAARFTDASAIGPHIFVPDYERGIAVLELSKKHVHCDSIANHKRHFQTPERLR